MTDAMTDGTPNPAEAQTASAGENVPVASCGRVIRGLPFSLADHNDVTIGSKPERDVVIEGADDLHATLRWEGGNWVVHDDPAPMNTLVNGTSVQSRRLDAGDWLEIAGVRIRFDGEGLSEIEADAPVGLRVTVRHLTAEVRTKRGGFFPGKRKQLLDDISFETAPGKFVAILGPSGSGKSSLIQRLAGLAGYEGSLRFNGREISEEKGKLLPLTAYLPQSVEAIFHEDMRITAAMTDFSMVYLDGRHPEEWAEKAFAQVGLDWRSLRGMRIRDLSGGQKRRLALVLALQREPQLLLLDEPTAGLDPASEAGIMELLKTLAGQGRTVLCATHVLGNLDLCDEVLVLGGGGRQAFYGTPKKALAHFGANTWLEVYRKLDRGDWQPESARPPDAASPKRLPPAPDPVTFKAAFCGTFLRLSRGWLGREGLSLAGIPLLVALVMAWACKSMFGEDGNQETVCFCMAVAVFWMGLSRSVQGLVKERIPRRCLDRMRGMPLTGYFAAHTVHTLAMAVVQTVVFTFVVFLWRHDATCFSACALPAFAFVLSLAAFSGGCIGLCVSACSRTELRAVSLLPLVAILALFLSKPVLEEDGKKPEGALEVAERAAPTFFAQECLSGELERYRVANPRANGANWLHFLAMFAVAYPGVFLLVAFWRQWRAEARWDGR